MGFLVQGGAPPDDSVTTAKIQDDAVTSAKVAAGVLPGKNLIINSDFGIWQRGTAFPAAANGLYTVDRYKVTRIGAGVFDVDQDTSVPANDSAFSVKLTVSTADASVASGDLGFFHQRIEANNTSLLALGTGDATSISVSFWARSSVTGVFTAFLQNSAQDRTYPHEFSIAQADTWEQFSYNLTGDVSGTWLSGTNGIGLIAGICLWAGSDFQGTNDTWNAGGKPATSNLPDTWINSSGATFYLSRFQVEVGSAASDFEHRDYASELARCSRYFFQYNQNTGPYQREHWGTHNVSTTQSDVAIQYPVAMRAGPTFSTGASVDDWRINGASCSAIPATVNVIHEAACRVRFTVASGLVLNEAAFIDARVAGAKLVFDAEL